MGEEVTVSGHPDKVPQDAALFSSGRRELLPIFEVLISIFLLWNSLLPFQNYEELSHLWIAGAALWLLAFVLWRSRRLVSTSLLFHLSLTIAYYIRADLSEGWLHQWLFARVVIQWAIVLWFAEKRPENRTAPSLFLLISFVGPLLFAVLDVTHQPVPGLALSSLLILRMAWLEKDKISIPKPLLVFLLLCLVSIPFSYYSWHNYQFFILNCLCVLLYSVSQYNKNKEVFLLGYLNVSLKLISFAFYRELHSFWLTGPSALKERLAVYAHHHDLAPLFVLLSCFLFAAVKDFQNRLVKVMLSFVMILLAVMNLLTYSRNAWLDFTVFACIIGAVSMSRRMLLRMIGTAVIIVGLMSLSTDVDRLVLRRLLFHDPSLGARAYFVKLGLETVGAHPFFGVGWLNFYTHIQQLDPNPLAYVERRLSVPIQSHSAFVDMCQAGGIALGILFLWILIKHVDFRRAPVYAAALVALILNFLLDSACFWLPVYIHLWILCGAVGSLSMSKPFPGKKFITIAVPALLILAFLLPVLEDRFLMESQFYLKNGLSGEAVRRSLWSVWTAPLDVEPLQQLEKIYLSEGNAKEARIVLKRLISLKKDYAPYFSDLATLELHDGNLQAYEESLRTSQRLDPQAALGHSVYLRLAEVDQKKGNIRDYNDNVSLSFLLQQDQQEKLRALSLISTEGEDVVLNRVLQFAGKNARTIDDWSAAMINFYTNLMAIDKQAMAGKLIPIVLENRKKMDPQDVDDFCLYLTDFYAGQGQLERVPELMSYCTKAGAMRIMARLELLNNDFVHAEETLRRLLKSYDYASLRWGWEALYTATHNREGLRTMYRILESLPSADLDPAYQDRIAASYAEDRNFSRAAEEYHHLSFFSYTDPCPHWREARFRWLGGDQQGAENAGAVLQRLIPQNPLYSGLYRSDIDTTSWDGTCIIRAEIPNELGWITYRTGMFVHPPNRIRMPADVKIKTIEGALGILSDAWPRETDGASLSICSSLTDCRFRRTVDPKHNPEERGWTPFSFSMPAPGPIILKTDYGADNRYDWLVLVVNKAE